MGDNHFNDTSRPSWSLTQDTSFQHSLFIHQIPSQATSLNQPSTPTPLDPPSRSPSPLHLSPRRPEEVDIADASFQPPTPVDRDILQESHLSGCHSECLTPDSQSLCSETAPFAMNVSTVRSNLASKGFYYDDEGALARDGQAIIDEARGITTSQRNSPTSKDNARPLKEAIARYCGSTERTLVFNVWHILRQDHRDVTEKPLSPQQEGDALAWVKRAWEMDYLDCVFEADLNKDFIPDTSHTDSKITDIMFKDLPRIEQPRPDVTYGLWKKDISSALRGILDVYHCELAKDLELPFFLVEVKTLNALLPEAENQCIRGGAVLVNGHHQWNRVAAGGKHTLDLSKQEKEKEHARLIEKREKAGIGQGTLQSIADDTSLAFSLAFSPSAATMHVHWREVWENGVEHWHAHTIHTYAMRHDLESYEQLGMHITNILDWGCTTRRMEIEQQAKVIAKRKYEIDEKDVCFELNKRQKSG